MRFTRGHFCRDCGLRARKEANSYTLKFGWWSVSGWLATPITLISNTIRAGELNKLPAPVPPAPAQA
ncbi:hypothetical protein [Rugosimonospora acidiphila]